MKNPEFNLLDEPWIPVRLVDGTITDIGLLELLRRTTDIADLACELPTQSIAIQRLAWAHPELSPRLGQAVGGRSSNRADDRVPRTVEGSFLPVRGSLPVHAGG